MDNRETLADVVFEYTGVGCSVPKDVTSVRDLSVDCKRLGTEHLTNVHH